jgi:hypothetical protein
METGFQYVYARKLVAMMRSGKILIIHHENYVNEKGLPGIEYVCTYGDRRFYFSESRTELPSQIQRFIRVLSDTNNILIKKPVTFLNRHGELGLYLEARSGSQWFKFHTR